jgi:DNA-binding SARP family transcriptional activator/class 3 adenylate cyclase/Tfp pilus assembly protein PilF
MLAVTVGPSETVTFLFTDIEGSTALWERDPDRMRIALAEHDRLVRASIERHGGAVFKTVGDAFCAAFADPAAALEAAIAAQHALQRGPSAGPERDALRVRIALHIGTAEVRDGDYFGPPLNRVARMLDAAHGGQVLLSRAVHEVTRGALPPDVELRDLGEHRLRDLAQPERLYQVVSAELRDDFPPIEVAAGPTNGTRTTRVETGPATATGAVVEVYALGGFRVMVNGRPLPDDAWRRRKARQLFKCLVTRRHYRLVRDEAIELLWPESDPEAGATNLRSNVLAIRRALAAGGADDAASFVVVDRDTVSLRSDGQIWLDADAFEQAAATAQASGDPLPWLQQANELYAGDLLPEDIYEDWAAERREALKRIWVEVQLQIAEHAERRGDTDEAGAALLRLLGADACDERAGQELMRLYARHGRRADALRVYQRLTQSLHDELGVSPSTETIELHRGIVEGRLAPSAAPRPATGFVCAYPFPAPSQLVGRQVEMARLERALQRGSSGGQVILVGAPAGTGKSTLLGAQARRARDAGVLCLAGGCYEQEGVLPLGPFQDALADYLLSQAPERVCGIVGSAAADLALVVPELRHHLDLSPAEEDRRTERMRLFGAVHTCLRALAEQGPVLLCLEDLHAADAATLQLLHYLARQTRRLPLTLVGTFRSEYASHGQPLAQLITALSRERLVERLDLTPLDRDDSAHLVAALLEGPATESLNDSLYSTTEGNPLFLEQLVLALREEGRVDRRAGLWEQAGEPASGVPTIVRQVVGQRFERQSPGCREMLAMAGVLGQTFDHRTLLASCESLDEQALLGYLEEAIAAQLLSETPHGYAFGHALLRETVYWSLSAPRRMLLHGRAARAIERLAGSRAMDAAAELAHHFALAGDAPELQAKAIQYGIEAGRRAAAVSAHRQAFDHFSRVCGLLERAGDAVDAAVRLEALEGRGYAERELGLWSASATSFRSVLHSSQDPLRRARAYAALGFALHHTDDMEGAIAACDSGLAELEGIDRDEQSIIAKLRLQVSKAVPLFLQGRYIELDRLGEQMVPLADSLGTIQPRIWAHSVAAYARMGQGRVVEALHHYELALDAAEHSEDKVPMAIAHENLCIQNYRGGRFATSRAHAERAVALFRDTGSEVRAVNAMQTLGRLHMAEGNLARAQEQAELALALATEAQDRWVAECRDLLGVIYTLRCQWRPAETEFEQALEIRKRVGHAAGTVESTVGLGIVRERQGDWAGALDLYLRALHLALQMDPSPQRVAALRNVGRLRLKAGDLDAATQHLDAAVALAETIPMTLEYAPTLAAKARLAHALADVETAIRLGERSLLEAKTCEASLVARGALVAVLASSGRPENAWVHAEEMARLASRFDSPYFRGVAHVARARATIGDHQVAEAEFAQADREFNVVGAPYERATVLLEWGSLLTGHQSVRAGELVAEARSILSHLGSQLPSTRSQR